MLREYLRNVRLFSTNARLFLAGSFIGALGLGMVWALRNLYLRKIGLNDEQIGNVLSGNSLGVLAVTVPAALLMDRWRLKGFLVASFVLGSAGIVGQVLTLSFPWILAWSFVSGVGMSLSMVAGAPFCMRNTGPSERVYLFGFTIALTTMGSALSMVVAGLVTRHWGESVEVHRHLLMGGALLGMLGCIPIAFLRESVAAPLGAGAGMAAWFAGKDWRRMGRLCLPEFVIGCGAGLTIPFINLYFETRFTAPSSSISNYYAVSQVVNVFGFLAAPLVARRLGLVRGVVLSQLLSTPFFAALAVTTDLRVAVGAFLLRNMLMNMAQPLSANFAMELVGESERAVTNCLRNVSWNLSWVLTATAGGHIVHNWRELWQHLPVGDLAPADLGVRDGFSLVMFVTITLYVVAAAGYYAFFRSEVTRGRVLAAVPGVPVAPALASPATGATAAIVASE
ncbi:MAG: MFS transporter [Planctomycetes bacterium]|nr:MFS transporter [Planctomycetota bacterium]